MEAQQQEALAARERTAEDPAQQTERATLMLARSRALSDLQVACAPAHRAMLEQAIRDLDARLAALAGRR